MDDVQERLWQMSMPETFRRTKHIRDNNIRFAHYTTAESGFKILASGRMLLRNSAMMNDFSEVQHGLNCLVTASQGELGERFNSVLRKVQPDLPDILSANFLNEVVDIKTETYLVSISEHGDHETGLGAEDVFGRLSMWRAYARQNGIAFIFNNVPFMSETNVLNAFTSPVHYATPESYRDHFAEVVANFEKHTDLLIEIRGQAVHDLVQSIFTFAAQSTKHPAFAEEREWRVIYTPTLLHNRGLFGPEQMEKIPSDLMTLGGVPQRVFAIPFKNYPEEGFVGASIPELLDRILIGPSVDAVTIRNAFVSKLYDLGVAEPDSKVVLTDIPLRT